MMKKMTYATTVIVRKRTIAHRIRRTRYWNIGLEVSHRLVGGRTLSPLNSICETERPKALRLAEVRLATAS
jgi:hypothetical protein